MNLAAEIILPLPIRSNFDYRIPENLEEKAAPGQRVLVIFGKRKIYTGLIKKLYRVKDSRRLRDLKFIDEILDENPIINEKQFALFDWIASYYFCSEGEVMKAALPTGLKPESTLRVELVPGLELEDLDLDVKEHNLLERLQIQPSMTLQEVSDLWDINDPGTRLRNLAGRGLVMLIHRLEEAYKPKFERYIDLAPAWKNEEILHQAFDSLRNAPKQEDVLMLVVSAWMRGQLLSKKELMAQMEGGSSALTALVKKEIIIETEVRVDRMEGLNHDHNKKEITLNDEQVSALAKIRYSFSADPNKPVLLHGVTGSGKTHIYIELIRDNLEKGKQVLYLLPEIGLTKQIIDKVRSEFGDKVGVYHSRFNDHERVEIWQKVVSGDYQVVIGVRSSFFLPFSDLGLIIVDEEHDHSFKQNDPSPRYQARDLSVYATRLLGCNTILGSATPAFESYYNALQGRYCLVEIKNRATDAALPVVKLIDMREQFKKKLSTGMFSLPLVNALALRNERNEQSILFQNRRGFSPWLVCTSCGYVPHCINCDITLTYHKKRNELRCHYCGYTDTQTQQCDKCSNFTYKQQGVGTEKIEEQVTSLFPKLRVSRMDLDTTRGKQAFDQMIRAFETHQIDMLVGTQMVTKGLDVDNVTLVGVIDADPLLNFPDFRAYEHAYQLLTQVSGRAGRSDKAGEVYIQTRMPDNRVLQMIQGDFRAFYEQELVNRKNLNYPPFSRLIKMELRNRDREFLESQAFFLRNLLIASFGSALLGPEYPPVAWIRNEYRLQFLFKLDRKLSVPKVREVLRKKIDEYYEKAPKKTVKIVVDVDPA